MDELDQKLRDLAERSLVVSNNSNGNNGNNNSDNSDNSNNTNSNNNSNNVTQINNIQINGFGKENLSGLNDNKILNILRTKYKSPPKLVKAVNIDMKENSCLGIYLEVWKY